MPSGPHRDDLLKIKHYLRFARDSTSQSLQTLEDEERRYHLVIQNTINKMKEGFEAFRTSLNFKGEMKERYLKHSFEALKTYLLIKYNNVPNSLNEYGHYDRGGGESKLAYVFGNRHSFDSLLREGANLTVSEFTNGLLLSQKLNEMSFTNLVTFFGTGITWNTFGMHESGVSTLDLIFCNLHSGGKLKGGN